MNKSEPVHLISLGAGVQSSTMALMAAAGEILPKPYAAIFADTMNEPQSVYAWLEFLKKTLPFPVVKASAGNLAEDTMKIRQRRDGNGCWSPSGVPAYTVNDAGVKGAMPRQCTHDFKLIPIMRATRKIMKELNTKSAVMWIGISIDESHRMKPSRVKYATHIWPLIDKGMSRNNCLEWLKRNGFPQPPRSACVFCPYHSDAEWLRLKRHEPESFEKAVEFEGSFQQAKRTCGVKSTPFLHKSRVPLSQVVFDGENTDQPDLFGNECEGMCGV